MVKSQPILRYVLRLAPAVAAIVMLSGCGTLSSAEASNSKHTETSAVKDRQGLSLQSSQDEFESMVKNVDIKSKILNQYAGWKGVRYRMGGSTKKGVDCSGFVQLTFREQFGLVLPRDTSRQQATGKQIKREKLRPGDLVLFRAGSTGRHVGIYIGNDNFVHASTSSGVIISSLNDKYWNSRYHQARRVLNKS
ncbi:bifunctional murein DD-endopeptidase/murein LD-carboxypeptidase [Budvicia aquatica]|uniref:Bifunctional murein DD-endopeptidase/murein LD-carboxypeptidase n=1 Tax=Budvicia aquatica TaxID=82979 RepID=A0A2C6DSZ5_9GAMM|nr:bifunctional murein DD-endopeptidase/murein LD-carboxypeptidase [Budvicia aquatica]PHI31452.1 bifunctional murein DD-endopeptidase/murein LD-carboxypeptidase [Budvicia aquatica]VFS51828.1 Probable endopeptidase Spr precursor [Budvicia aquatica]